jgi:hypothetical protein
MKEAAHAKVRRLAKEVAWQILDDSRFRTILREVVLRVLVEQEQQRKISAARSFLDDCAARGVKVRLGEDGQIRLYGRDRNSAQADRIGPDLSAVLSVYRREITAHLEMLRDLEEASCRREAAEQAEREARKQRGGLAAQHGNRVVGPDDRGGQQRQQ